MNKIMSFGLVVAACVVWVGIAQAQESTKKIPVLVNCHERVPADGIQVCDVVWVAPTR